MGERIGHGVQNILAHKWLSPQRWIPWKDFAPYYPNRISGGYFTHNPYTNW